MVMQIRFEPPENNAPSLPSKTTGLKETDRYSDSSEMLVVDVRGELCPAEQVEKKLKNLLGETSVPLSHLRMRSLCVRR